MKRKINYILLICTSLSLVSCENENNSSNIEYKATYYSASPFIVNNKLVDPLFTNVNLIMYSEQDLEQCYQKFDDDIKDVHKQFDRDNSYYDRTNLKTLNDAYGKDAIKCDPMLVDVLKTGIEMTNLTAGYFNIGMGNLIDVYGNKFDFFGVYDIDPDKTLINEALLNVPSIEEVNSMLTIEDNKVTFNKIKDKNVVISLGGIAKGYALDKETSYLSSINKSAIISCGSSSISTINNNPLKDKWSIALRLPTISFGLEIAFTINLKGTNYLSTSADNEKNYIVSNLDGSETLRHHILNPYTGYSENYHRQVFVTSNNTSGTVLDALSTALMNIKEIDEICNIINKVESYYNSNIEFCVFDNSIEDGCFEIYITKNLNDSISGDISEKIIKTYVVNN